MTRDDPADPVIFKEVQRFTQFWVWLAVLLPAAMAWYGAIEQLVYGRPYGTNPVSDQGMVSILVAFGFLLPLFILSIRLVIVVRNSGIYVKFFPVHLSFKHYPFESISAYDAVTYRPLRDYGGWGIRYGSQGKAYNIKGNRGLMLKLTNGKHLLLGSQESDVLKMSVDQGRSRTSN
ncbi:DUF6141 family protein [Methanolobus profundi]|uniref:Uncharacterized protein n=1 Tax=Methanolobus profundi TaxID=487685 RepID=A0A1I4NXX8_9EURY|nr:DUF6141 family protein [Methanolobus profundi]SFM20157.1 hypothetical protein SAMN04488696_0319 [Methanolobus profundi]